MIVRLCDCKCDVHNHTITQSHNHLRMDKRVRIIDIAKKAGVSKGTVDRVIHKRGNVAPKVEKKVRQVMKELKYRPNIIASTLASNKTWRIATLLPDPKHDLFWVQPQQGIEHAIEATKDYGMHVDIFHYPDRDATAFLETAKKVLKNKFDALLLAPLYYNESHQILDLCCKKKIPYGLINTFIKREDDCCLFYLGQDSYHSGLLAAKLLDFGSSDGESVMVLHLEKGVFNSRHLMEKERGFQNFYIEHPTRNIQVIKTTFETPEDTPAFKRFMELHLESYPKLKGIFVTTSKLHYLVKALEGLSKRRIKLVGFDLIDANIQLLNAEKIDFLINQNPFKQGYQGIINIFNFLVRKHVFDPIQNLPLDVVMKENASYYLKLPAELEYFV